MDEMGTGTRAGLDGRSVPTSAAFAMVGYQLPTQRMRDASLERGETCSS